MVDKKELYVNCILAYYPEVQIDSAVVNISGQKNDVLIVNDNTFALLEALFGIEHKDKAAFEAGMRKYI